jgi:hypothetical protein
VGSPAGCPPPPRGSWPPTPPRRRQQPPCSFLPLRRPPARGRVRPVDRLHLDGNECDLAPGSAPGNGRPANVGWLRQDGWFRLPGTRSGLSRRGRPACPGEPLAAGEPGSFTRAAGRRPGSLGASAGARGRGPHPLVTGAGGGLSGRAPGAVVTVVVENRLGRLLSASGWGEWPGPARGCGCPGVSRRGPASSAVLVRVLPVGGARLPTCRRGGWGGQYPTGGMPGFVLPHDPEDFFSHVSFPSNSYRKSSRKK